MTRPSCGIKTGLINGVTSLHHQIAMRHDLEVKAIIAGDFTEGDRLAAELAILRTHCGEAMVELKQHVLEHGC
jgi:hypothetical protein